MTPDMAGTTAMMGSRDRLKHTLENELSRTLAEVLFHRYWSLINHSIDSWIP